jgi:hypothetical protein
MVCHRSWTRSPVNTDWASCVNTLRTWTTERPHERNWLRYHIVFVRNRFKTRRVPATNLKQEIGASLGPRLRGVGLRGASRSFQQGMAVRVADRHEAMHRERDANVATQRFSGTALILVKQQVVDDAFRETRDPAGGDSKSQPGAIERGIPARAGRR